MAVLASARPPVPMAMADPAGDVDRISALPDDLLHFILSFVRDAKAVTRTAALSRRWRRVWIYAQQLALLGTQVRPGADPGQFVDWVLAQRGEADIEALSISMSRFSLVYTSQEKVNSVGPQDHRFRRVNHSSVLSSTC